MNYILLFQTVDPISGTDASVFDVIVGLFNELRSTEAKNLTIMALLGMAEGDLPREDLFRTFSFWRHKVANGADPLHAAFAILNRLSDMALSRHYDSFIARRTAASPAVRTGIAITDALKAAVRAAYGDEMFAAVDMGNIQTMAEFTDHMMRIFSEQHWQAIDSQIAFWKSSKGVTQAEQMAFWIESAQLRWRRMDVLASITTVGYFLRSAGQFVPSVQDAIKDPSLNDTRRLLQARVSIISDIANRFRR